MRTKDVVILASWLAATVISAVIILKGGTSYLNLGIALLLYLMAIGASFSVGYSLYDREELKLSSEISSLNSRLEEIERKINSIEEKVEKVQKFLEE
ncbi:hypothetical protein K1720_08515 [Thermococcus argininiproducens]|uniref:Uncharacterized protein n=1 Tax=Thermococcus argininiproducens TaxID=2866384 RepID=A0A9E7SCL2_9EURY|nr:hypothetical protein [Thermococcus argininiproducens]USG99546.1 hypothetical protein K1720_08515 [Thermococcus argininiproducens]